MTTIYISHGLQANFSARSIVSWIETKLLSQKILPALWFWARNLATRPAPDSINRQLNWASFSPFKLPARFALLTTPRYQVLSSWLICIFSRNQTTPNNNKRLTIFSQVQNDAYSSILVELNSTGEIYMNQYFQENLKFKGEENALIFSKTYKMAFHCNFWQHNYPFDTQFCYINVSWLKTHWNQLMVLCWFCMHYKF